MSVTYVNIPREVEVYFTNHDKMNDQGLPFIDNLPENLIRHFNYKETIKEWVYEQDRVVALYDCLIYEPATGWHDLLDVDVLHSYFTRKICE